MRSSDPHPEPAKQRLAVGYGAAKVMLARRSNGFVAVSWNEGGRRHRTTRADWNKAVAWAKNKTRALDAASGQRWVTPAAADRLAWLESIAGGAEAATALLADLAEARKILATAGGSPSLREAAAWFAAHGPPSVRSMTLHAAVTAYLDEYERHHPSISVRGPRAELKALAAAFPDLPLLQLEHETLGRHVTRGGAGARTVRNRISYWVTFFRRAAALGWFPEGKNPASLLKRPRLPDKAPAIFTPEEGRRLLEAVAERSPQHLAYLVVAGWLGCRPFECQRLRWDDFDFPNRMLHIRPEVAGKTLRERWVPLPETVARLLEACRDARRKRPGRQEAVARRECVCRAKAQNTVSFIARAAGLRWEIDILRHSRITYRLAETRDIGLVAEESGNSPAEIRASYKRPIPPGVWEKWMAALDGIQARDWHQVPRPWSALDDALLGTMPDAELALRLGRDVDQVMKRRLALTGRRKR